MIHDYYSTKRVAAWRDDRPTDVSGGEQMGMSLRYQDGYTSWCPLATFERDYQPITAMSFGHALHALKAGKRVCRARWASRDKWLSMSGDLEAQIGGRVVGAHQFWSQNNADYARQNGGSAVVLPCITMKTADGAILMGWTPSQPDMLADDWMIVGET